MLTGVSATASESEVGHQRTILLVDDEDAVVSLLQLVLTHEGFVVLTASNGREALETSRGFQGDIDLVITDLKMPQMNGLELLGILERERPGTRAIVMTGECSGLIDPRRLKQLDILYKPFVPQTLLMRINAALDMQHALK